jgi:hypothetical protein
MRSLGHPPPRTCHCERKRSNPWLGIARSKMDCFAPLAMTIKIYHPGFQTHTSAISRRDAPELCMNVRPKMRAWGMPGAQCTRSLACKK